MSTVAPPPVSGDSLSSRVSAVSIATADLPTSHSPSTRQRLSGSSKPSVSPRPLTPLNASQVNRSASGDGLHKKFARALTPDMVSPNEATHDDQIMKDSPYDSSQAPKPDCSMETETKNASPAQPPPSLTTVNPEEPTQMDSNNSQTSAAPSQLPSDDAPRSDPTNPTEKKANEQDSSARQGLGVLLGAKFDGVPMTSETLAEALKFKCEQERTKQEFYRMEARKRSLELLNTAVRAGIPAQSIALLFNTPNESRNPQRIQSNIYPSPAPMPTATTPAKPAAPSQPGSQTGSNAKVELINYEDHQKSPTRYRGHMQRASTSVIPGFGGPSSSRGGSSETYSSSHGPSPAGNLQFHHWRPNQTRDQTRESNRDRSNSSPRKDADKRKSIFLDTSFTNQPDAAAGESSNQKLARSPQPVQQHSRQPSGINSSKPSPASVVAAQNTRRRTVGHARHRSETAISRQSWYGGRHEEGIAILANMASERSKHNVDYILDSPNGRQGPGPTSAKSPQQQHQQQQHQQPPAQKMVPFPQIGLPAHPGLPVGQVPYQAQGQPIPAQMHAQQLSAFPSPSNQTQPPMNASGPVPPQYQMPMQPQYSPTATNAAPPASRTSNTKSENMP